MGASLESSDAKTFPRSKVDAVQQILTQAVENFRDLVLELEQLHVENSNYKNKFLTQKEKLDSQPCSKCEELKLDNSTKEKLLNSIITVLNKAKQTKDFNVINAILKQLNKETNINQNNSFQEEKNMENKENIDIELKDNGYEEMDIVNNISPKKEVEHIACEDESVCEIEGTPTGRKSPILKCRKSKHNINMTSLNDKKKCPDTWPTSENKIVKLLYPSPSRTKSGGRLRQGRLNLVKMKTSSVVDLTCSPESTSGRSYSETSMSNLKKEVIDNDETILPSPTSGPIPYPPLVKSIAKDSPTKFKKPSMISKFKIEVETSDLENKILLDNEKENDNSINLLNQYPKSFKSPMKRDKCEDETLCVDESMSLLHQVKKTDSKNCIRSPVYKEAAPRTKAEKRALPGWSCNECKNFYDELYKNDPEMLAQKMDECSKHRGRNNPARPKTPDGFWNPRWDVPEDTEEFNRRNNAI